MKKIAKLVFNWLLVVLVFGGAVFLAIAAYTIYLLMTS